jgi:hypothetical protein
VESRTIEADVHGIRAWSSQSHRSGKIRKVPQIRTHTHTPFANQNQKTTSHGSPQTVRNTNQQTVVMAEREIAWKRLRSGFVEHSASLAPRAERAPVA